MKRNMDTSIRTLVAATLWAALPAMPQAWATPPQRVDHSRARTRQQLAVADDALCNLTD